jgi:hypothetical protein
MGANLSYTIFQEQSLLRSHIPDALRLQLTGIYNGLEDYFRIFKSKELAQLLLARGGQAFNKNKIDAHFDSLQSTTRVQAPQRLIRSTTSTQKVSFSLPELQAHASWYPLGVYNFLKRLRGDALESLYIDTLKSLRGDNFHVCESGIAV